MNRRSSRRLLTALGALVIVSAFAGCGSDRGDYRYVALGDSFVAGGGIANTTGTCLRSDHNYPSLIAKELKVDVFVDRSCGGATTDGVLFGQERLGVGTAPSQIKAVTEDTDLVTVSIGGNDGKLYPVMFYSCFIAPTNTVEACRNFAATVPSTLAKTRADVANVLETVQERAPRARVVLVGYLRVMPDSGPCETVPVAPAEVEAAAVVESAVEDTLSQAAQDAGVTFVSVRGLSEGHDACSPKAWVNGVKPPKNDGALLHPNAAGMVAVAKAVEPQLDRASR